MTITTYTKERDCVLAAESEFFATHKTQLIFKKGRKYICVAGELTQKGEPFQNIFGETRYHTADSDVRAQYESNGYELRGWVNDRGSFKNN